MTVGDVLKVAVCLLVPNCWSYPMSSDRLHHSPWYNFYGREYPEMLSEMYQGDILLPPSNLGKNAIKLEAYKWPKGTIPYIFHDKFANEEREKVLEAMKRLETETCIKFVPLKTRIYNSYIDIGSTKKGCYAMIGYHPVKNGQGLPVNLQVPECTKHQGTIEHELLHVMGILHEQARSDRDQYVKIMWENIDKNYWSDFSKASEKEVSAYGVPYDVKSVMHYPAKAFSKNGKDTIVSKIDAKAELGQRDGATQGDLEKVRMMYCKNTTTDENEVDYVEDNRLLATLMEYLE